MTKQRTFGALSAAALLLISCAAASAKGRKIEFWDAQRRGADCQNHNVPSREWWAAAKEAGIAVVRLFPNNWKTARRDFLLGDADRYEKIDDADFQTLKRALDDADAFGIKVVITTVSLPGLRWRQQNNDQEDARLWHDFAYHAQAAAFWKDLASRLKEHPAVVGYNILNEPHPERARVAPFNDFWWDDFRAWYAKVKGTPADLNLFYARVVASIRSVDRETPVVLDSGLYATPWAFDYLTPVKDGRAIYSLHMAEPYAYTNRRVNKDRFSYPGVVAIDDGDGHRVEKAWNAEELDRFLDRVGAWQKQYGVPARRVFVGEFGCSRNARGAAEYLGDLVRAFNRRGWHWAFYQFRSDGTWTDRDYEFGTRPPGAAYWEAAGRGEQPQLPRVEDNPVWNVLKKALRRDGEGGTR